MALVQRVDIVAPLLKRGQPLGPRTVGIGDVVDLPAEAVDLKHRLALLARQNAHRRVERTAGRGCPVTRRWLPPPQASCAGRRFGHGPPSHRPAGRSRSPSRRGCRPSSSSGPRCTRLAEGIAHLQQLNDLVGESLDHRDLEPEPEILDFGAERFAFIEQRLGSRRERMQALQERRPTPAPRRAPRRKRLRPPAHRAEDRRD